MGRTGTIEGIRLSELLNFLPKQWQAWAAIWTHRYILYGGARGGGKSRFLRWALLAFLLFQFTQGRRGVRVGLFCETYPDLRDRQISKIRAEFPAWLGSVRETQADGLCYFLNERFGGGMIALRNLDDPAKYQSAEFAAIGVDELTKILKGTFDILRGSLRWPGVSHTVFIAATNPGGIGHMWVKQLWVDRDFPPELRARAHEFIFIQALPSDNPHLDKTYWDELNSLPEELRRAWVEGDWEVFAGRAFPGWRRDVHVVQPFQLPEWWPKWRCVDWGFAAPFCCLWLARDVDRDRVFVYREAYASGLTDVQQAQLIRQLTPIEEQITITYADPSMWAVKAVEHVVRSSADVYMEHGVWLQKGDNDRISGKRKVDGLLTLRPDGLPGLQVFETVTNLIRVIPSLARDKLNPEDVDTKQEDHPFDALKYGLTNVKAVGSGRETGDGGREAAVVRSPIEEMFRYG